MSYLQFGSRAEAEPVDDYSSLIYVNTLVLPRSSKEKVLTTAFDTAFFIALLRSGLRLKKLWLSPDLRSSEVDQILNNLLWLLDEEGEAFFLSTSVNIPLGTFTVWPGYVRRQAPISQATFGIVMSTYYRSDGSSKEAVISRFQDLTRQSYQNFHLYLMGDHYQPVEEFDEMVTIGTLLLGSRLTAMNLPVALERENCQIKRNLWCIGGANAMNQGLKLARAQDYYVHLDDDDYWHPFHLRNLALAYQQYPTAEVVITCGILKGQILPRLSTSRLNNYRPMGGQSYHSCLSFKTSIPVSYQTLDLSQPERAFQPADYQLLEDLRNYGVETFAVPNVTVIRDSEARFI